MYTYIHFNVFNGAKGSTLSFNLTKPVKFSVVIMIDYSWWFHIVSLNGFV